MKRQDTEAGVNHDLEQLETCAILGVSERELYVTEAGFEAVAKCADGNTCTYRFDDKFNLKDKASKQG